VVLDENGREPALPAQLVSWAIEEADLHGRRPGRGLVEHEQDGLVASARADPRVSA